MKMRERIISCDKFEFISILEVIGRKAVNEHASLSIKGHIAAENDDYVIRNSEGKGATFTAMGAGGSKTLFSGIISGIEIHAENEMRTLAVNAVSRSALMDISPATRTFQDSNMTYKEVTGRIADIHESYNILWPEHGGRQIGGMAVQYNETDWHFAKRLAGRLGTVVVPDYLLDEPYISIGLPKRPAKQGIDAIWYSLKKDMKQYREGMATGGNITERDAICYTVKSREIYDLCDPVPFLGQALYVYAVDTRYEGDELVHYYTLKEKGGFFTQRLVNENLTGVSLRGRVVDIMEDKVRVHVDGDVAQTEHKWFPYATPFTQPDGYGWYFMPEIGDEVRLQFPSEKEVDAYVSSAVHVTHGNRQDPEVKFIRTVYGQIIQFDPERIMIDDGSGSRITMHMAHGITIESDKTVNIDAGSDITVSANGKVTIAGQAGVVMQKGDSVINVDDAIDVSSEHTRVQ
jgi:hypothetical protein